eukprot:3770050-Pyramimonas_sp.AAC.1
MAQNKTRLDVDKIIGIGFANWTAVSVYNIKDLECQQQLLSTVLNQSDQNIALVTMPVHAYKRGSLWQLENAQLEAMSRKYVNIDRQFSLLYDVTKDRRDGRPLCYPGR